jgi:hypothetical protein
MMLLILMSFNLSPQGPPELQAGQFWTYSVEGQGNTTLRIVQASPSDAGTALRVMVSTGPQISIPIQVVVARDRKSIKAWMDGSRDTEILDLAVPELKVGSRWELRGMPPELGPATITDVRPEPVTTPAGSFPNAVRVSGAIEGQPRATMWLAPGVGLVGAGLRGEGALELVDYGPRGAGGLGTKQISIEAGSVRTKRISIEFKDAPVVDAIKQLIEDEPVSIAFRDIPEDLRVTATIRDASPEEAVRLLCEAAGLEWQDVGRDSGVIRMPPSVTVGGSRVPLVGAMPVGPRGPTLPSVTMSVPQLTLEASPGVPWVSQEPARPTFDGDDKLVDLDVKDAPIREAMAKLAEASGIPIHVADPVSNDLKVTARVYRMPLGDVLSLIVTQANLTYTVGYVKTDRAEAKYKAGLITAEEYESSKGTPEIYIVPKPELTVYGPGAQSLTPEYLRQFGSRWIAVPTEGAPGVRLSMPRVITGPTASPNVSMVCPKCKHIIKEPDAKFCPACGAKLPSAAEPAGKAR